MSENNYGALMMKTALSASIDIDSIFSPGIYRVEPGNPSSPDVTGGFLIIHPGSTVHRIFSSELLMTATSTYNTNTSKWSTWQVPVSQQKLSSISGSAMVGTPNTGTVEQGLFFIIPQGVGDDEADDTDAVQDAINRCKNGMLVIPPGKKYRCKNLVIPHPMTIWSHGRREDTWLSPYGNDGDFVHSGNFIQITTDGTVTFFNVTIEARHRTLTFEDGKRLNGVHGGDNTSNQYLSGFHMYNTSVSGFSGYNIVGGSGKSFGIMKDCQSESSGLSCLMVRGVDWRINHCAIGRSKEKHGIEIYGQSNAITNCDTYFNYRDGISYEVSTGAVLIDIIGNVVNSNGENGIRVSGPYSQPAGTKISSNKLFNNSKNSDGAFSNIVLSYGRGHQVFGNVHFEYSNNEDPDGSPRCGFCLNLLNGASLSGPLSDAIDPLYSYRSGAINVNTQSLFNQSGYTIGSYVDFVKGLSNDTRIAFSVKLNNEGYDRVKIGAGKIFLGNGASEPSHGIQQLAAYPGVTVGIRSLGVTGSYLDSVLRVGGHRIWSGEDGTMRTKWNSNGSSATDGGIISSRVAVPSSPSSAGTPGQYAVDSAYRYDCVSQNAWVRTQVTSW